jgi:hypothetical protein
MVTTNEHRPGMNAPVKTSVGIRFEPNGTVTLISKTVDYGHGHAAPFFAQVLVDRLGIPFSRIRLYFIGVPPAATRTPEQITQPLSRAGGCTSILTSGDAIVAVEPTHLFQVIECEIAGRPRSDSSGSAGPASKRPVCRSLTSQRG